MHPLSAPALRSECRRKQCYDDHQKYLVFAREYNYIGGFAQGSREELIKQHLYRDGPVVLALHVGSIGHEFFAPAVVNGNDVIDRKLIAGKLKSEPKPDNKEMRRW